MSDATSMAALDELEAAAWRDIIAAAPAPIGLACERAGAVTILMAPRLPTPLFNRALGLGNDTPATEAQLDEVLARFRAASIADPWIQVSPSAQSDAIAAWLGARGFVPARRRAWAKVVRGMEPAPVTRAGAGPARNESGAPEASDRSPSLEIRELDRADAPALARVLSAAFGLPPLLASLIEALVGRAGWRAYGALDGADLVAGGLLRRDAGDAWLGFGGTLASHRGRGAQGALMARRITDAIAAGASTISTETGAPIGDEKNPSLDNMIRCGFRIAGERANWCLAAR